MLRGIQQRDQDRNRWIKISMGVILVLICVSMVVTLVPGLMSGPSTDASSPDAIASVAGHNISVVEFQQRFDQLMSNQQIPQMMRVMNIIVKMCGIQHGDTVFPRHDRQVT